MTARPTYQNPLNPNKVSKDHDKENQGLRSREVRYQVVTHQLNNWPEVIIPAYPNTSISIYYSARQIILEELSFEQAHDARKRIRDQGFVSYISQCHH